MSLVFRRSRKRAYIGTSDTIFARFAAWLTVGFAAVGVVALAGVSGNAPADIDQSLVSRASIAEISLPDPLTAPADGPVSQQLRRPLRVTDTSARQHDLGQLIRDALIQLGHPAQEGDVLYMVLLNSLAQGESDATIDAVLNAALARGEFQISDLLLNDAGALDTRKLLDAVLAQASS